MSLNIFSFIHFTVFVVYVFLAIYILLKNYKAFLNRFFFLLFSCFAIWSFGFIFVHNHNSTKEAAALFMNIASLGWIWVSVLFLWFAFMQARIKIKTWAIVIFTILPSIFFSVLQWSGRLIVDYKRTYYGWGLVFTDSWEFYIWVLYYLLLGILIFLLLATRIVKEKKGTYRTQTVIILIFSAITLSSGTIIDVFLPFFDIRVIPDAANLIALVWLLGIGYAIVKYKLFIITPIAASENILFTMSDMLIMVDFEGKVVNINKSAEELLGFKNKEIKNLSAEFFFEDKNIFLDIISRAHFGEKILNKKVNLKRKDDKLIIPVMLTSSTIKDEKNNFIGIIFVARDVSNIEEKEDKLRKQAKKLEEKVSQLKEYESRLYSLLENLNDEKEKTDLERKKTKLIISNLTDPVIYINNQNKIDLINPAAQVILKLKENAVGSEISESNNYCLENFRDIIGVEFECQKNNDQKDGFEEIKLRHFDQSRIFKVLTTDVKNAFGDKTGVLKIFYDFTRERSLENLKSEFISIASHKLRTPLSAIKWVVKMALDGDVGKLNEEQFDLLNKAYKSNERIIELVNNLLDVSRIEEGRFGYNFKKINFKEVIDVINDYAQALSEKNKIRFSINCDGGFPEVNVDQDRIILVLQNLVDNAMKYTPSSGKIEVNIKTRKKFLEISVKDNGVGIPSDDQKKLFTKFFRAKNVIRMQTEGSGLGLFIVKNIIEKHKGGIKIKSKEGIGTEIIFSLPLSIN